MDLNVLKGLGFVMVSLIASMDLMNNTAIHFSVGLINAGAKMAPNGFISLQNVMGKTTALITPMRKTVTISPEMP